MNSQVSLLVYPNLISRFEADNPDIHVRLVEVREHADQKIKNDPASDVVIMPNIGQRFDKDTFVCKKLFVSEYAIIAGKGTYVASLSEITPDIVADLPVIADYCPRDLYADHFIPIQRGGEQDESGIVYGVLFAGSGCTEKLHKRLYENGAEYKDEQTEQYSQEKGRRHDKIRFPLFACSKQSGNKTACACGEERTCHHYHHIKGCIYTYGRSSIRAKRAYEKCVSYMVYGCYQRRNYTRYCKSDDRGTDSTVCKHLLSFYFACRRHSYTFFHREKQFSRLLHQQRPDRFSSARFE